MIPRLEENASGTVRRLALPLGSYGFKHRIINGEIVLMRKYMFQVAAKLLFS
jgi:hypothetical protein